MNLFHYLLCAAFQLVPHLVNAQNHSSVELNADYGEMILHSQDIRPIGPSSPFGLGLDYSYWLMKETHWQNCHCYPRAGFSLNYHNFDKPDILGYGIIGYGFLEPWYRLAPRLFFTLRGGGGYAWLSKPFNEETNPLNLSYSLHFTPYVMVGAGLALKLNSQWRLTTQLRYNHASNGGQQEPNKGLNYPTANLSLSYSWQALGLAPRPKVPLSELIMDRHLRLTPFIAGKSIDKTRVTFAVPGLEITYTHQLGRTSALSGGLEWISNLAYREKISQQGLDLDHNQLALLLGHRFLLGNFSFGQLIGVYLYRPYDIKPDWYQRYSLMWYPFKNFGLGTALKAHGHVAEFLDFRLSYRHSLSSP